MDVMVMGGSRFMGLRIVEQLLNRDHSVTVFNRGTRSPSWSRQVESLVGDRDDAAAMRQLATREFDGIIDLSAYTGTQTAELLAHQGHVQRLVHISSGAVYQPQPSFPWAETTPDGPWNLWGEYGVNKLDCELLLRSQRDTNVATTALRLPYVLGPENYAAREEFVFNRLLDHEVILVPGDGKALQSFVSVDQVAHTAVSCVETFADGGWRAFNIASPELTSLEGFIQLCAGLVSIEPITRRVGGGSCGTAEVIFDAANCVFPFPNENYVLDLERATRTGIAPPPTSLETMLGVALAALQEQPARRRWSRTDQELKQLAVQGLD